MDNNILLKKSKAVFEPHILKNKKNPFIFHDLCIGKCDIKNFHENLELLYFKKGTGYVKLNDVDFFVKPGDVIIVNSYVAHQIFAEDTIEGVCFIIDNDFCKNSNLDIASLFFEPLISDINLNILFDSLIYSIKEETAFKQLFIKTKTLDLLSYLCSNYASFANTKATYPVNEYIRLSINYIKNNLCNKITADDVSKSVGISKYHFLREFKKNTGYTLVTYINIIRLEYAKELLANDKMRVKEVALLCGFDNYSYFTNTFKKYTGLLPSEYKKIC